MLFKCLLCIVFFSQISNIKHCAPAPDIVRKSHKKHGVEFNAEISLLQTGARSLSYGFKRQASGGIPPDPYENLVELYEAEYNPTATVGLLQKYNNVFLRTLSKRTLENTQDFLVRALRSDITDCIILEEKLDVKLSVYLVEPEKFHEEIQILLTNYKAMIESKVESIAKYSKILTRVMSSLLSRMIKEYRTTSYSLFKLNNDNIQAIQRGLSFYQGLVSYLTDMGRMLSCNHNYMKETALCAFITTSIADYSSRYSSLIETLPGTKEYQMFEDIDHEEDIKEKKIGKSVGKKGKHGTKKK
ncbi:hypothetical protein [Cryptosporidium parvum Iowa II]|uniref:Secreted protein n=2 Tax=Cryptosporidium parvum TaxID=5807 RepID=Q5CUW9_CRYPI|nr:hypothetical protein [Cryptosporidium parvum Iowa II]EAK89162.1 conserved hypothetical protein [Cryptosporidium parvum Iowa II]QOY42466.1 Uncharacterized protein CPATCC_0032130 [Cryptosporidium parvum]WKS76859.1 hypothetical protein CPCDC_3g1170 [Cryptosporidium sp. 43IA8]WRK31351.1 Uncharacterized protein cpbgf_3001170 [Cryptosporidium parvum]|eukprot:QOY42466.1 hypothetical protein CPATCC_001105 [Cryptosporidium parvum]